MPVARPMRKKIGANGGIADEPRMRSAVGETRHRIGISEHQLDTAMILVRVARRQRAISTVLPSSSTSRSYM